VDTILRLDRAEKRRLIHRGRKTKDPQTALRFLMIVKLAEGLSRQQVARDLRCAPATVVRTWKRYHLGGEEALLDQRAGNGQSKVDPRFRAELWQVLLKVPTDFGWQRPTWTRELLCLEMTRRGYPRVADCTMGRALCAIGARLTAPKPVVLCPWDRKRRERVLASLRHLANNGSTAEPVFFEDEMDVHLNPKIGRDWMVPGHRRRVVTPGKNKKHFVAGALNAATRKLTWVEAPTKASDLFCKLVWKLATGTGSLPAPVSRYIDSNSAWNASSKISWRCRRRKAKSFRLFFSRFRMNCSCLVTVSLGRHRSSRPLACKRWDSWGLQSDRRSSGWRAPACRGSRGGGEPVHPSWSWTRRVKQGHRLLSGACNEV